MAEGTVLQQHVQTNRAHISADANNRGTTWRMLMKNNYLKKYLLDGAPICCSQRIIPTVPIQYTVSEIQNGCNSAILSQVNPQNLLNELSQRLVRYCSVEDATVEGAVCC